MRIGLFGGTFDPIHFGHLLIAEQALEQAGLDAVWFLPAAFPPHKSEHKTTSFEHRCNLIDLAIAGHPAFVNCQVEAKLPKPSFTIQTLKALAESYAGYQWFLILGADSVHDLPKWHRPVEILERVQLLAVNRPGSLELDRAKLVQEMSLLRHEDFRLHLIQMPLIELSSRDIRSRVKSEKSIRFMVPNAVHVYIREKKLYFG